jgi:hypothetical protein
MWRVMAAPLRVRFRRVPPLVIGRTGARLARDGVSVSGGWETARQLDTADGGQGEGTGARSPGARADETHGRDIRVFLRPVGTPVGLGLAGLMIATTMLGGL